MKLIVGVDIAIGFLGTADQRDEIIVWDQNEVWIYTQDRPFAGERIYAPKRNPEYNESNYRTTVSMPAWEDLRRVSRDENNTSTVDSATKSN